MSDLLPQTVVSPSPERTLLLWERPAVHRVLIAVGFFAVIAPTLTWLEFAGEMENFNVATARWKLTARNGHWAVPTMEGIPRAAEAAAGRVGDGVGAALQPVARVGRPVAEPGGGVSDAGRGLRIGQGAGRVAARATAYRGPLRHEPDLPEIRPPGVLRPSLSPVGHPHQRVPRPHLLRGERWLGCTGAGVALGLAVMCKGPVAVVQLVVPFAVVAFAWRGRGLTRSSLGSASVPPTPPAGSALPALLGLGLLLLVSLPWPIYVVTRTSYTWRDSLDEIRLKTEAEVEHKTGWHTYLVISLPLMIPWAIWFVTGLIDIVQSRQKETSPPTTAGPVESAGGGGNRGISATTRRSRSPTGLSRPSRWMRRRRRPTPCGSPSLGRSSRSPS